MLPHEPVQPQHVVQLLPGQDEPGIVGVCVRVCGVVRQQDALQHKDTVVTGGSGRFSVQGSKR